jgi:hypothetical protein
MILKNGKFALDLILRNALIIVSELAQDSIISTIFPKSLISLWEYASCIFGFAMTS